MSKRPFGTWSGVTGRCSNGIAAAAIGIGAVTVMLAGCTADPAGSERPSPSPAASMPTPDDASTVPTDDPTSTYDAVDLALCDRTELAPLSHLALTVVGTDSKPPAAHPGASCLFDLTAKDGSSATLLVEAVTVKSVDDARLLYGSTGRVTVLDRVGKVAGVGQEAEAFARDSGSGPIRSEYMITARDGNLVTKVWLTVSGDQRTSRSALESAVRPVSTATIELVPRG